MLAFILGIICLFAQSQRTPSPDDIPNAVRHTDTDAYTSRLMGGEAKTMHKLQELAKKTSGRRKLINVFGTMMQNPSFAAASLLEGNNPNGFTHMLLNGNFGTEFGTSFLPAPLWNPNSCVDACGKKSHNGDCHCDIFLYCSW